MAAMIRDAIVKVLMLGTKPLYSPAVMVLIGDQAVAWMQPNYCDPQGCPRPPEHRIRGLVESLGAGVWSVTGDSISAVITEGQGSYGWVYEEYEADLAKQQKTRQGDEEGIKQYLETLIKAEE